MNSRDHCQDFFRAGYDYVNKLSGIPWKNPRAIKVSQSVLGWSKTSNIAKPEETGVLRHRIWPPEHALTVVLLSHNHQYSLYWASQFESQFLFAATENNMICSHHGRMWISHSITGSHSRSALKLQGLCIQGSIFSALQYCHLTGPLALSSYVINNTWNKLICFTQVRIHLFINYFAHLWHSTWLLFQCSSQYSISHFSNPFNLLFLPFPKSISNTCYQNLNDT